MARSSTTFTKRPANAGKKKGDIGGKSKEIKKFFADFISGKEYRENIKQRILKGRAPHIETLAFHYTCGKPAERVQIDDPNGLLNDHDAIAESLIVRITSIVASRSAQARNPTDVTPGTASDVLLVEGTSQAEPITAGGIVDDVADTCRSGMGKDTHGSGDDQDVGGTGDQATSPSRSHTS